MFCFIPALDLLGLHIIIIPELEDPSTVQTYAALHTITICKYTLVIIVTHLFFNRGESLLSKDLLLRRVLEQFAVRLALQPHSVDASTRCEISPIMRADLENGNHHNCHLSFSQQHICGCTSFFLVLST